MQKRYSWRVFLSVTSLVFLCLPMHAKAEKGVSQPKTANVPQEKAQVQDGKQVGSQQNKKNQPAKGFDAKNLGKMLADMCAGIIDSAEMQVSNTKNGVDISISSKDPTHTALAQNCAKMLQMVFVTYKTNRKK